MRNRAIFLGILAAAFFGLHTSVFSDTAGIDSRDVALDKSLGGMKEGSRILSPHGEIRGGGQQKQGTLGSHVGSVAETHRPAVSVTAPAQPAAVSGANHGFFPSGSSGGAPGAENQAGVGAPHEGAGANFGEELGPPATGNTGGTLETFPGGGTETGGSSGGIQEPAGGGSTESSIIEVDADANLETDNPSAGGDVTINPDAGGGLLDADTEMTTNTGGQETTSGSGTQVESTEQNSIIETDVDANLSGENTGVNADVGVDPNADDGLVDAEAATSTDIVEQELTSSAGLEVDHGANTTAAETTMIGAETGGTTAPATNEVTGGVEADVEGAGAGDDVECNPAEGLLCPPKL